MTADRAALVEKVARAIATSEKFDWDNEDLAEFRDSFRRNATAVIDLILAEGREVISDDEIISIAVETSLLNYIDNETPRRFFVSGHAELDDVVSFGRIIAATALQKESNVIRAEALEEAAKVALILEEERVGIPCPDGIKGCAVFHFRREQRPRTPLEIAAAIRALKEKA